MVNQIVGHFQSKKDIVQIYNESWTEYSLFGVLQVNNKVKSKISKNTILLIKQRNNARHLIFTLGFGNYLMDSMLYWVLKMVQKCENI